MIKVSERGQRRRDDTEEKAHTLTVLVPHTDRLHATCCLVRSAATSRTQIQMQKLEGSLAAIGENALTKERFGLFQRDSSLLEVPQLDGASRRQIVEKSAATLLEQLGLVDRKLVVADASDPLSPRLAKHADPLLSPRQRAAAGAAVGGGTGSPRPGEDPITSTPTSELRKLFEAQVKYVAQRELWREAVRRSDSNHAPIETVVGLLGEAVAAGVDAVPSLRLRLPSLAGIEMPPSLRHATWSTTMLFRDTLEKNTIRLRSSGLAAHNRHRRRRRGGGWGRDGAGHRRFGVTTREQGAGDTNDSDNARFDVLQIASRMVSRGLASFRGTASAGYQHASPPTTAGQLDLLEVRACAFVVQLHACGDGGLPTAVGSLALPLAYVLPDVDDDVVAAHESAAHDAIVEEAVAAAAEEVEVSRTAFGRGKRVSFTGPTSAALGKSATSPPFKPRPQELSRANSSTPGLLAAHLPATQLPTVLKHVQDSKAKAATSSANDSSVRKAIDRPLEPAAVAMLMRVAGHCVPEAVKAASDDATGVWPILEKRWPRLLKHLISICQREDLSDLAARQEGKQPPRSTLHKIVVEQWVEHAFVGSLPRDALLFVWDQLTLQGWGLAAEIAAACLYLMRREVRRLDHASAGATELRGAMRAQLFHGFNLSELQALLAPASALTRQKTAAEIGIQLGGKRGLGATISGSSTDDWDWAPQVMLRLPLVSVRRPSSIWQFPKLKSSNYNPDKPDVSGFKRRPSTYRQHWDSMARFRRYSRESAESGVSGVSGRS